MPDRVEGRATPAAPCSGTKKVSLRIEAIGVDTSTPTGKLMLNMLGAVAQFEREMMLER